MTHLQHPAIGHIYEANFGPFVVHMQYDSAQAMTFTSMAGPDKGRIEAVAPHIDEIRPGLYESSWIEADGSTVVQVEDYKKGEVSTTITHPDMRFEHLHGTLCQVA